MENNLLESMLENSVRECNQATTEHDNAIAERDAALAKAEESRAELNWLVELHDQASRRQQMAAVERYKSLCERDSALCERDEAVKKYHSSLDDIRKLEKDLSLSEKRRQDGIQEIQKLEETNRRLSSLFSTLSEEQGSLRSRVHALETRAASNSTGPPLKAIQSLASKLFPLVHAKKRLQTLFDLLYDNRLSFRKHVNNKVKDNVKDNVLESVRLSCCKEMKSFFTGWKFLKALDCSTQSLNQVNNFLMLLFVFTINVSSINTFFMLILSSRSVIKFYIQHRKAFLSGQRFYLS
jgi:hypothetical protein